MRRKTVYSAIEGIDRSQLEAFQAGMRKRYSDEHILEELNACAKRLGRSPTMREFEADPETTVHPQTVIEHFKSWNRAKRQGYEIAFVPFANGKPSGPMQEFLTGWMLSPDNPEVWGRPVGVLEMPDGSLLVSDEGGKKIWRVAYRQ